ncbi:MAG: hypothetical protein NC311_17770 [Muribaculaceae bacterium]|nr:hypothetical protein [Muribaculaceae bacterium]
MTIKEKMENIYSVYLNKINPMIVEYEVLENNFPISVFNEIRAIFIHLAKATFSEAKEKRKEIDKAERHIERLLRDCYKYNCVALEKKYCEYVKRMDLMDVDITPYIIMHEDAIKYLFDARVLEGAVHFEEREKEIYNNYSKAYTIYKQLNIKLLEIIEKHKS